MICNATDASYTGNFQIDLKCTWNSELFLSICAVIDSLLNSLPFWMAMWAQALVCFSMVRHLQAQTPVPSLLGTWISIAGGTCCLGPALRSGPEHACPGSSLLVAAMATLSSVNIALLWSHCESPCGQAWAPHHGLLLCQDCGAAHSTELRMCDSPMVRSGPPSPLWIWTLRSWTHKFFGSRSLDAPVIVAMVDSRWTSGVTCVLIQGIPYLLGQ